MTEEMKEITKGKLVEYVRLWKYYNHAYLWTPYARASERRKAEKNNNFNIEFLFDGHDYVMSIVMNQSAKHVYVTRTLLQDGRKVSIRALSKYLSKEELKK
jgi:hypothetical protein